jgi:hypothetical protein
MSLNFFPFHSLEPAIDSLGVVTERLVTPTHLSLTHQTLNSLSTDSYILSDWKTSNLNVPSYSRDSGVLRVRRWGFHVSTSSLDSKSSNLKTSNKTHFFPSKSHYLSIQNGRLNPSSNTRRWLENNRCPSNPG